MPKKLKKLAKLIKKKTPGKCYFCEKGLKPDYKDIANLTRFMTPRKRIISHRDSGVCVRHQRQLSLAVKRARQMALI